MKLAACLAAAALVVGCSSLKPWSPPAWSPGAWSPRAWLASLASLAKPATGPVSMSDEQAGQLQQEAAQLRRESDAVWTRLAQEKDREQRSYLYDELRALGERLAAIERSLRDAGRPTRTAAGSVPAA